MRTTADDVSVRLYRLDDSGGAGTIFYGSLAAALARAEQESDPEELFLQTANDVVAYLDLIED